MEFKSNNNVVYPYVHHVVFCPKYRCKVLVHGVDERLTAIVHEVARDTGADVLELHAMADQVHLLLGVDPQFGIHRLVRLIKGRSSRLLRHEFPWLRSRLPTLWTYSYFVRTTGSASGSKIKQYIESQQRSER